MKTLKYLKRAKISFAVFVFCGFLSIQAFFLNSRDWNDMYMTIGIFSMCGWIINPFPLYYAVFGLKHYWSERKNPIVRNRIGNQWWLFPVIGLLSIVIWMVSGLLFVEFTGGV